MRALWVIVLALVATACGGTSTTHPRGDDGVVTSGDEPRSGEDVPAIPILRDSRAPNADETAEIAGLVEATAAARGLAVARPIDVRIAPASVVSAHLVSTIEDEELLELVDLYVAIGLLERGVDVVSILERVTAEQVVGFYDPKLDVLVIREDVMTGFARTGTLDPEALITIVHEIVHALQGQHLALRERMDAETDIDVADAYQSLVEGDATLGMLLVAARIRRLPLDELLTSMPVDLPGSLAAIAPGSDTGPVPSDELTTAPAIIRIGLIAPYVAGLGFCSHVYRSGGTSALDAAHARPPVSMEQIMHPEKYDANEAPVAIGFDALDELRAAGWSTVTEDTLGELELGIYLGQGTPSGFDAVAASGWGGDRVRVLRRGDVLASVIVATFDSVADAVEAEAAARRITVPGRTVTRADRVLMMAHGLDQPALAVATAHAAAVAHGLEASR